MARLAPDGSRTISTRARGRPTLETVAQIDRGILDAAREQFFEHGYAGTSMAMIVKAAGISKTTIYARYATKADLFQATVHHTVDKIANLALRPGERGTQDLAKGLIKFGNTAMRTCISTLWANYERLGYAEGPQFPELANAIAERVLIAIETVAGFIAECGERDGIPCRDPHAIATVYIMAVRGFHAAALLRDYEPSVAEQEAFVGDLVNKLLPGRPFW